MTKTAKTARFATADDVTFDTEAQYSLGTARTALVKYVTRIEGNEDLMAALTETLDVVAEFAATRMEREIKERKEHAAAEAARAEREAKRAAAQELAAAEAELAAVSAKTSTLTALVARLKG